uniref:Uncharacterized protein n=2 Tax=unclassified bacterial viruses TaxID=12333 RepID=A0AAU7J835_9VIRU
MMGMTEREFPRGGALAGAMILRRAPFLRRSRAGCFGLQLRTRPFSYP